MSSSSLFNSVKNSIAKYYSGNAGKMLVHTGAIGWTLSSVAQILAIVINDKIPKEQKMFLVPQEAADAAVNILSFYCITQSCNSLAKLLTSTGKWVPKAVKEFLVNNNLASKIGKVDFNVLKDANLPADMAKSFKNFSTIVDVGATTAGSVLSCNIVTPVLRNYFAAERQKSAIDKLNESKMNKPEVNYFPRPSMVDFQSRINSGSLKI